MGQNEGVFESSRIYPGPCTEEFHLTLRADRRESLRMKVTQAYCGYWDFSPEFYTTKSKTRRTNTYRDQKISLNTGKAEMKEESALCHQVGFLILIFSARQIHLPSTGHAKSCSLPRMGALLQEQRRTLVPGALYHPTKETSCHGFISQGCCNKWPQTTEQQKCILLHTQSQKSEIKSFQKLWGVSFVTLPSFWWL